MEEHLGPYTLHFIAHEMPDGTWRSFITIDTFDESAHDFRRLVEKQPIGVSGFRSRLAAIEAARQAGNRMVEDWQRQ
ncbi:hypothetical protein [Lacisediminimonas sp.]|uniref:hypothetical protein n=1 Tax=Lacisediminimonas sp. TaxID=3060582 RepID=UPI0027271BB5|nr:hypothetical protein [Lacisediminimonas sp.]MDO8299508.1 hypothetical protein [Lacisediminimonas sp.]